LDDLIQELPAFLRHAQNWFVYMLYFKKTWPRSKCRP